MTIGHFFWTDLSTYDVAAAKADYAALFGWSFEGGGGYSFAHRHEQSIAGLFEMPDRLAAINMPSFWMSYVHVDDLDAAVKKARTHEGVIIEVEPQAFDEMARIALVRDPSGAGFTLYEGSDITPPARGAGEVTAWFHHVPNVGLIAAFYQDLFGWSFSLASEVPWRIYNVIHPDGAVVARVEEVPEAIRGKYRYWMPCFGVERVDDTIQTLRDLDGERLSDLTDGRVMVADRQGAHFMISPATAGHQAAGKLTGQSSRHSDSADRRGISRSGFAWKACLGLGCVVSHLDLARLEDGPG